MRPFACSGARDRTLLPTPSGLSWLLAMLMLAGCSDESADRAAGPERRDSLGVEIIEYPGPLPDDEIALELVWTHGHAPGEYEFQYVFQGVLHGDGGALVGDGGNREVVRIEDGGAGFTVAADTGEGPGEISRPRTLVRVGTDTAWVEDMGNARLMLFERGALVESVSTMGMGELAYGLMPIGVDADGALLMVTSSYRSDFEVAWLDGRLVRYVPGAERADTVGSYPMAPRRLEPYDPFGPSGWVVGAGRAFVQTRSDEPRLIRRAANGAVTRIVRWTPVPRYPTDADWTAFADYLRADLARVNPQMSSDRAATFAEEQLARYAIDRSRPLPALGWVVGGYEGVVWVADFEPIQTRASSYRIFGNDGTVLGRADFGRPVQLLDVSDRHALVVIRDDFDVQAVALYRYGGDG